MAVDDAEFGVLGPLTVWVGGRSIKLTRMQRTLLVVLLLEANQRTSLGRIADRLWGDRLPSACAGRVRTLVAEVRKAFGPAGAELIVTQSPGYMLRAPQGGLDADVFAALTTDARKAVLDNRIDEALDLYDKALGLWRGAPLEDVSGPFVVAEATRLESDRIDAVEARAEIKISKGRYAEAVREMSQVVAQHALRERPHSLLMRALHGNGRTAEALQVYRDLRDRLVTDLGIEPSTGLRELHQQLLSDDLPLEQPLGSTAAPRKQVCLLPRDIADFVGREAETESVQQKLRSGSIVAISGFPGVGKSTLAIRVAHHFRPEFPDGQLFARLHGASPEPRDPADVLAEFLRALGVDGGMLPDSIDERASMYRDRLADRAVLLVLDDAQDETQIEPLLPGTAGCGVIVTSRGPLTALPGARSIPLDVLPERDACALLDRVAGAGRVQHDPKAAGAIIDACGRLPLAIRIAGARLASRPSWPLADFAARLNDRAPRLDEFVSRRLDIRAGFDLTYAALSGEAQHAFRLLGMSGLESATDWSVSALLGVAQRDADRALEALIAVGLISTNDVDAAGQPRYRCHDLLQGFAREVAKGQEDRREHRAAVRRLAKSALERVRDAARELPLPCVSPRSDMPSRTTPSRLGRIWLLSERENLFAVVRRAVELDEVTLAADLAESMSSFLKIRGYHDGGVSLFSTVAAAAARAGRVETEMRMRLLRADVLDDVGRSLEALCEFESLLEHFSTVGDWHSAAYALSGLGSCEFTKGDYPRARRRTEEAIERFEDFDDVHGLLDAWLVVAGIHLQVERYEEAIDVCRAALQLIPASVDAVHRARLLRPVGIAQFEMGDVEGAIDTYKQSLRLSQELGWDMGERITSRRLGEAYAALGEFDLARGLLSTSSEMFARAGDPFGLALIAFALGEVCRWQGDEKQALRQFISCRDLLSDQVEPRWRERANREIARSYAVLGNHAAARSAVAQADAIAEDTKVPEEF